MNVDRFESYLAEGRLIRNAWTSVDEQGRATACALAALFDAVAKEESWTACPADALPRWFAALVPWMDDSGTDEKWAGYMARLSKTLRVQRTAAQWDSSKFSMLALIVREAKSHSKDERVVAACDQVIALCERAARGDIVTREKWAQAATEAKAAEAWAAWAAAKAAEAAGRKSADRIIDGILCVLEAHAAEA